MNQTTYQVTLSADGNHSVGISGDDPEVLTKAIERGKKLLAELSSGPATTHTDAETQTQVPTCPTHQSPMMHRVGNKGAFWFCPTRNDDGSWCDYKREARR
jgi:hypothetical protein